MKARTVAGAVLGGLLLVGAAAGGVMLWRDAALSAGLYLALRLCG